MSDEKTVQDNIVAKEGDNVKVSSRKKLASDLLAKANTLPNGAGCYLMKNKLGAILYVGKAKSLKSRVTSYFNASAKSPKTVILVSHIADFEFMLTNSEAESYVLESNLIKKYRPKYNIRLKDDKSYPYVKINNAHNYPRLEYVRRPKRSKKVELFGPYPVGSNISGIMRIITKAFALRDCSDNEFRARKTPCILYQMKQCSAPCVGYISEENYQKDLNKALSFLGSKKKFDKSMGLLQERMKELAENELFEQAAAMRDYMIELEAFGKKSFDQSVENLSDKNTDIIAYYAGEEEVDISLYLIREGNLLGHKNFHFLKADLLGEMEEDLLAAIIQYYSDSDNLLPEKIITNFSKSNAKKLGDALLKIHGENLKLKVQSETPKYTALINATRGHAMESGRVRAENADSVYVGLHKLKDLLKLKDRPKTLECYDIAIWQGKSPTAARIVFYEGKADKTRYRHYHLQERPEGNNDFAMLAEVFERRMKHGELPDVFIVDGGIGQVNAAKKVLEELECDIPVVGIAKARDILKAGFQSKNIKTSDERLIIQGRSNPYILQKNPSLMKIVVSMRDEAHRFSRRLHHKAEHKRVIQSWVDEVKGLNNKVRKDILRMNTLSREEMSELSVKEIQDFFGLNSKHARTIFEFLHAEEKS